MVELLKTRRWLGFTALVVAVIIAFGLLSLWQWSRAEQRRAERVVLQERLSAAPVPLPEILRPGADLASGLEWRPVSAQGRYDTASLLVRRKPQDGRNGMWVMTRLALPDGTTVWINRGWVPANENGSATQAPPAPAPDGPVALVGRLRPLPPAEGGVPADVPAGQITEPSSDQLLPPGDYSAYVELTAATPRSDLTPVAAPQIDEVRNVSYAIQWILFATIAILGWWFFLRREAREDTRTEAHGDVADPSGDTITADVHDTRS